MGRLGRRLISVRRIRGTWIHEIVRPVTSTLLMRDYSTGAFLDWEGRIKPAPNAMMEALVQGEPADTDAEEQHAALGRLHSPSAAVRGALARLVEG